MTLKNENGIETEQINSRMGISRYLRETNDTGMIHSNYCQKHETP